MTASQPGNFNVQEFTDLGTLLIGGRLYTYAYGTTTKKTAYTDAAGAIPHTYTSDGLGGQYIALNARGELPAPLYLAAGSYDLALKTATGATIWTRRADPIQDVAAAVSSALSASSGSLLIGYLPLGSGPTATTVQDALRFIQATKVNPQDAPFYAKGDGVTDDTAAINAAVAYAKTLTTPHFVIPAGVFYSTTGVTFDLPNYSTLEFIGSILTPVAGGTGVKIGSSLANTFGLTAKGIKVARTAIDTAGGSIGVQLRSLVNCYIDIRSCTNFQDGVYCSGTSANGGFSYNEVHFGNIQDNRNNVHLTASGVGYCNENSFYCGNFNHNSGYPAVTTNNILVDHFVTSPLNDNRFFAPSLEDNSALAVAANISGSNNLILWPRIENPGNQAGYQIVFTANSSQCQIIGGGFTLTPSNISDLGSQNSWETQQGRVYQAQATVGAGKAVQIFRGTFSDSAKVLLGQSTTGVDKFWVNGDGNLVSTDKGYFQNGIRWSTSDASLNDRGLFTGAGSPETVVTAGIGSLYMNTAGGASTTLYVKTSGSGNTGWTAK